MENICAHPPLWISPEDDERLNLAAGPRKPKEPERKKPEKKKPAKEEKEKETAKDTKGNQDKGGK